MGNAGVVPPAQPTAGPAVGRAHRTGLDPGSADPTKKPAEMAGWKNRRKGYPAQAAFAAGFRRRIAITPTKATPPKIAA